MGRRIKIVGSWVMPSSNTTSDSSPAAGTPIATRPIPTINIWIKAMPTTPWATARMVEVHSAASCAPRSAPEMREAIATALCCKLSPFAIIRPAIMRAATNTRTPVPMPANWTSRVLLTPLIWGAICEYAQLKSLDARLQTPNSVSPIKGQLRTESGGGGISMAWLCSVCMLVCTELATELPSKLNGPIRQASPSRISRTLAKPGRLPNTTASF